MARTKDLTPALRSRTLGVASLYHVIWPVPALYYVIWPGPSLFTCRKVAAKLDKLRSSLLLVHIAVHPADPPIRRESWVSGCGHGHMTALGLGLLQPQEPPLGCSPPTHRHPPLLSPHTP